MSSPILASVLVNIILGFKLTAIFLEHWPLLELYMERRYSKNNGENSLPRALAGFMGITILVLGSIIRTRTHHPLRSSEDNCMTADADIIGDGVRVGTWTQVVILAIIAIAGSYNPEHSAIQEIGAGLLVTHIALAISLFVPMIHQTLSPIDSILGTMVLDAQNSVLSIQLVAKQTLASR